MTKEFEALETFNYIMARCKDEDSYIIKFPLGIQKGTTFGEDMEKAYKVIKDALQRLEAIDNAKPSEALELVDKMANYILLDEEYGFISDEEKQAIIKDRDTIKSALCELKAIKEAKPNEALERLEKNRNAIPYAIDYRVIKQALIKAQEQEIILNLIKKKKVNVSLLALILNVDSTDENKFKTYNCNCFDYQKLTKEEFDTLKRWLEQ